MPVMEGVVPEDWEWLGDLELNSLESDLSPKRQVSPTPSDVIMSDASPDNMGGVGDGKRSRKPKEDKLCGVCGDRALGYNFDAISCESCKAFFRRNAPKGLEYFKCPYDNNCRMDVSNRRFCKRCRLKRCMDIGMRPEYILTDQEKAAKRKKIEDNRQQREVDRIVSTSSCSDEGPRATMTDSELKDIDEVRGAFEHSLRSFVNPNQPRNQPTTSVGYIVNVAEVSVRRIIDMLKRVKGFQCLSQKDQIALLKGGCIELVMLRSVLSFDPERMSFLDAGDDDSSAMSIEQMQTAPGWGVFNEHMKFLMSVIQDLKCDQTTMLLLILICLFSPDRPFLENKDFVSLQQERYSNLMLSHLESRMTRVDAHKLFPRMLMKLVDARNLSDEMSTNVVENVETEQGIQPLMKEMLDLQLQQAGVLSVSSASSSSPSSIDSTPHRPFSPQGISAPPPDPSPFSPHPHLPIFSPPSGMGQPPAASHYTQLASPDSASGPDFAID